MKNRWNLLMKTYPLVYLLSVLFIISLDRVLTCELDRNMLPFYLWYSLLASSFISFCVLYKKIPKNFLFTLAVLSQLVCFFHLPNLSTDFYRFIWDGEMWSNGINPYDYTPNEYLLANNETTPYLRSLYEGMGELSADNYSCYPTFNQFYFYVSTVFTDTIRDSVFVMRVLLFCTHLLGGFACIQLLKLLKMDVNRAAWLFLNPLFLLECMGNLHFEGAMLSFVLLSIYLLMISKRFWSAFALAAAIQLKLIPVLMVANLSKLLSMKRGLLFTFSVGMAVLALFAFCITLENGSHFFSSLKLYFSTFEFNSALVLPISEVLYFFAQFLGDEWALSMFGEKAMYWNPVPWVSPFFGLIVLLLCIKFFLHQKKGDWSSFFETSVMLFVTYYLMSSTVHPWYLVIPLGLSVFSSNKIPLLWSVSIFASYALYTNPNFAARVGIWSVQYIPILLILLHQGNWLKDKT